MPRDISHLMRVKIALAFFGAILLSFTGCGPGPVRPEEITEAFIGAVVQDGKPITLPDGARLDLIHDETYSKFGIPLKQDGSFEIGWMPTGKYSAELLWLKGATKDNSSVSQGRYNVPNGLTIEKDKTQYEINLGKEWKP